MRFWMETGVAERDTAAWLATADAVEAKLNEYLG
jgi:hypothetical protein